MVIEGNPKVLAQDIADAFGNFTTSSLKKYTPKELKIIKENLLIVQRDIRSEWIELGDILAVKKKNMKLQRISQALTILNTYCKKHRIYI